MERKKSHHEKNVLRMGLTLEKCRQMMFFPMFRFRFQRHAIQSGHVMFVTTSTLKKVQIFSDPACARIAVETLYSIQGHYPFFLYGFVIMPDHIHLLLKIPEGGSVSKTTGSYKRAVSFNIGRGPIWQSRSFIKIPSDPLPVLRYIRLNPVKAGLCASPEHYAWSSASGRWDVVELPG